MVSEVVWGCIALGCLAYGLWMGYVVGEADIKLKQMKEEYLRLQCDVSAMKTWIQNQGGKKR